MTTLHFDVNNIDASFPLQEYREGQKEAIEYAANAFNNGKDVVIIEAPTGSGKSVIGYTLMDMVQHGYYLTVTKILQDQLVTDFGEHIVELKGRSSYPCTWWDRYGQSLVSNRLMSSQELLTILNGYPNCGEGYCRTTCPAGDKITPNKCARCFLHDPNTDKKTGILKQLPDGMTYSACPYYEQIGQAINAPKVVMNFAAFLYQTQFTSRFMGQRNLLVCDEAHSLESIILDFVSLVINDRDLQQFGIYFPEFDTAIEYATWFAEHKLEKSLNALFKLTESLRDQENDHKKKQELTKTLDDLARTAKKFYDFMDRMQSDDSEWICDVDTIQVGDKTWRRLTMKPVMVHGYVHELLLKYAKKTLMMSATILDVDIFCKSLGLDRDKVATYRMKNRFPVESRPIYVEPCGKITGGERNMHSWGPQLVHKVDELVNRYPGKRGIVHTHNFAIAELLMEQCAPEVAARFTYQRRFYDKMQMLEHHADTEGSIIVAPAMHEGVDLYGDLSRLQIICKVPYPNYHEDKQLARRMEIDERFYTWLVALKLIQCAGRSIRSETDWADTYVIDSMFERFINQNSSMIPPWFLEAIHWNPVANPVRSQ